MLPLTNVFNVKLLLVTLLLGASLHSGTYDDSYTVFNQTDVNKTMNTSKFMDGNFEEIVRFDAITPIATDELSEESKKRLFEVSQKVKLYLEDGKRIELTVIGHSSEVAEGGGDSSYQYAMDVFNALADRNVSKEIMSLESRQAQDMGYSDATTTGKELSNRVMVSIYVHQENDKDSDKDGVYDQYDRCPNTPLGVTVDKHGCPIDSDKDGVADYIDKCPDTPLGYRVDSDGCPIDSDGDGVSNYIDLCPDTSKKLRVDPNGCPYTQALSFGFKFDSSEILSSSYPLVEKFAQFMKENKAYNIEIIGHTDSIGTEVYNMNLSQERANAVQDALINEGVEPIRVKATGRGELEPIESNLLRKGREANRRIEVKLSY